MAQELGYKGVNFEVTIKLQKKVKSQARDTMLTWKHIVARLYHFNK
jgi:hypothetical protein